MAPPSGFPAAQPLVGTEDASYPFWSPDSTFLAFFAQDKLKKIAVGRWASANAVRRSWSTRRNLEPRRYHRVFRPCRRSLLASPPAGGVPVSLAHLRTSGASDLQRFPAFLPDGIHFLYLQSREQGQGDGIYAGSLDASPPIRILPDASNAIYVPGGGSSAGYLLFRRESTLMAQPFDAAHLRTVGEMFPLADKVGTAANINAGAYSAAESGS